MVLIHAYLGEEMPAFVDTGILYIDQDNVDDWIAIAKIQLRIGFLEGGKYGYPQSQKYYKNFPGSRCA